jgi:hypothetical protein
VFDALDESIKALLIKEIPVRKNEIDIVFDQPTDEWSGSISRPTLDVYLYDIEENRQLRGAEQFSEKRLPDGSIEIRANPARVDLSYLITAWSKREQDQHHLLGLVMMALLRSPFMPGDCMAEGLRGHPVPITLSVAQLDDAKNWSDFWSTMDNKLRPGLTLRATLMIDPYRPVISSMVQSTEIQYQQKDSAPDELAYSKRYYVTAGEVISQKYSPEALTLVWEEKGQSLEMHQGMFVIQKAEPGTYHLSVRLQDRILKRHQFVVPSQDPLKIEV